MKKKLCLSSLSCLAFALAVPFTPVCAEDLTITGASGQTEVLATRDSSYKVLIPKKIVFSSSETSKNFTVKAYGNIAINETLSVNIHSSKVAMASGTRKSEATITFAEASWVGDNLAADAASATSNSGSASFTESRAGSWSGTATFDISLTKAN